MALSAAWLSGARDIVGDRLILDPDSLAPFGHDEYATPEFLSVPPAVVKAADEKEIAALVRLCQREKVPLTVRGAGTGLVGGCIPSPGGIVLSMELLNRVVEADRKNCTITVQAGTTLRKLYEAVDAMALYFPPHPGDEGAFIGGAVAANAGGARAVKYGTVRRFVLGLQVVLASGDVIDLGGKFIKSSSGYHLLDLMIGSEGTLGIITRVTLGLLPPVGSVQTLIAPFTTVQQAIEAVPRMLDRGIIPCAVEFVEHSAMRAAERLLDKTWPARTGDASLMIILDGRDDEDTLSQAETIGAAMEAAGALDVLLSDQKAKQAEILLLRSNLYEAVKPATVEMYDVCVPRSEIAAHVGFVHSLEAKLGVSLPTYGHAADGNVHSHFLKCPLIDGVMGPEIPEWRARREEASDAIYADVAQRGGVISGEHGIGLVKRKYLPGNLGPVQLAAMRSIKNALDPQGIFNPGKIFESNRPLLPSDAAR
jgi:glycolate oxidase